jgi:hypothetical protein
MLSPFSHSNNRTNQNHGSKLRAARERHGASGTKPLYGAIVNTGELQYIH